jgi:hypothetical protein
MYKFLSKNGTSVAFGVGVFISLVALIIAVSGASEFNALSDDQRATSSNFNFGLMGAIVLTILAVLLMVGFGLWQSLLHPKGGIRLLLGLVGIGLIGFLFYKFSAVETSGKVYSLMQEGMLTPGISKLVNGALWVMIILIAIAVLSLIIAEFRNLFK